MRRILARAKRRSRAFSKVSPSVSLSPFVVELVCAFYFAKGSSSSESPASRYTTPVMPTFSLSVEGECSKRTRKGRANFGEWRFFGVSKKQKLFWCCRRLFLRFFCFFYSTRNYNFLKLPHRMWRVICWFQKAVSSPAERSRDGPPRRPMETWDFAPAVLRL